MERINRIALSDAEYRIYLRCEIQVSDEHPIKCVCGRLATGLHERTCSKYRRTVDRLFIKTMRNLSKEHYK